MGSSSMQEMFHVICTDEANPFAALVITSDSDDEDEFVDATAKPAVSPDPDWHAEVNEALAENRAQVQQNEVTKAATTAKCEPQLAAERQRIRDEMVKSKDEKDAAVAACKAEKRKLSITLAETEDDAEYDQLSEQLKVHQKAIAAAIRKDDDRRKDLDAQEAQAEATRSATVAEASTVCNDANWNAMVQFYARQFTNCPKLRKAAEEALGTGNGSSFMPWGLLSPTNKALDTLYVNPPSKSIAMVVKGKDGFSVSGTADKGLSLRAAPPGPLMVEFVLTLGFDKAGGKPVRMTLPDMTVTKKMVTGIVEPQYIDLQLEETIMTYESGEPIGGVGITGVSPSPVFKPMPNDGGVVLVLPPAPKVIIEPVMPNGDPAPLPKVTRAVVPIPRPNGPQPPVPSIVKQGGGSAVTTSQFDGDCIVYLVDISGSMGRGQRMNQLKSSLMKTLDNHNRKGTRFAMGAWNTSTQFPGGTLKWLHGEADYGMVKNWISGLRANGGTVMKQAFEVVLRNSNSLVKDARHIYCACDGDITPFTVESWTIYRAEFPDVRFEFGLFGDEASDGLQNMGNIGGGGFQIIGEAACGGAIQQPGMIAAA
eukprot:COSAG02_NODE_759_length_17490_cov_29.152608_7_plen_594_part_00